MRGGPEGGRRLAGELRLTRSDFRFLLLQPAVERTPIGGAALHGGKQIPALLAQRADEVAGGVQFIRPAAPAFFA